VWVEFWCAVHFRPSAVCCSN